MTRFPRLKVGGLSWYIYLCAPPSSPELVEGPHCQLSRTSSVRPVTQLIAESLPRNYAWTGEPASPNITPPSEGCLRQTTSLLRGVNCKVRLLPPNSAHPHRTRQHRAPATDHIYYTRQDTRAPQWLETIASCTHRHAFRHTEWEFLQPVSLRVNNVSIKK